MADHIWSVLGFIAALVASTFWLVHIVTCLTYGLWGFLIAGAILFPIGIIHGFLILIGAV